MRCAEHDRENCPDPRCHVLAVCLAEVPTACDRDSAASLAAWSLRHGYKWRPPNRCTYDDTRVKVAEQIATRLVAWMHWRGERRAGPLGRVCSTILSLGTERQELAWSKHGPGHYHPLDAVMEHPIRVAALAGGECPRPNCYRSPRDGLRWHAYDFANPKPCNHDGTNWGAVAALLATMQALGISLDAVHKWRETCLYLGCAVDDGEECSYRG